MAFLEPLTDLAKKKLGSSADHFHLGVLSRRLRDEFYFRDGRFEGGGAIALNKCKYVDINVY